MEFTGKVVLITGASAGIGAATARKFAELGANVVIVGRNMANLSKVAKSLEMQDTRDTRVLSIIADVSKDEDVKRLVDETIETLGRLDILVNNAAFSIPAGILDGIKPYDSVLATNIRGVYLLTSLAAPHLIKTKGNIINISSVVSQNPAAKMIPHCISKAALDMFTKCAALDLAPHGVRVNSINPGVTKSTFLRAMGLSEQESAEYYDTAANELPLKRTSDTDEVVDMVIYVAGHRARGMTGSIVIIDNGHLLLGPSFMNNEN